MQTLKSVSVLTLPTSAHRGYAKVNELKVASVHREGKEWAVLNGPDKRGGKHVASFTKKGEALTCKDRVQAILDRLNKKPELVTA